MHMLINGRLRRKTTQWIYSRLTVIFYFSLFSHSVHLTCAVGKLQDSGPCAPIPLTVGDEFVSLSEVEIAMS